MKLAALELRVASLDTAEKPKAITLDRRNMAILPLSLILFMIDQMTKLIKITFFNISELRFSH